MIRVMWDENSPEDQRVSDAAQEAFQRTGWTSDVVTKGTCEIKPPLTWLQRLKQKVEKVVR